MGGLFVLHARGEISGELILWFGIIIAVLISSAWFLTTFSSARQDPASLTGDLFSLVASINSGCTANSYSDAYNPKTETGLLEGEGNTLCFARDKTRICKKPLCGNYDGVSLDLASIENVRITIIEGAVTLVGK